MRIVKVFLAVAALVVLSAGQVQADTYQIDDGVSETSVGTGAGFGFGNMFVNDGINTILSDISFGFGVAADGDLAGDTVTWRVFGSNSADPTVALTFLDGGSHLVVNQDFTTNGILDVIMDPAGVDISGFSHFFVAGTHSGVGGDFPIAFDQSSDSGQSWAILADTPDDWSGADTIGNFGLPGNWIIRANASAIPEPSSLAVLGLLGGLGLVRRRR